MLKMFARRASDWMSLPMMTHDDLDEERLHGTCVSVDGRAALLLGASGTGKSSTALQMMRLGAELVADDQTIVVRKGDQLEVGCPNGFEGMIEARGIGILSVDHVPSATLVCVVDLDQTELHRLPPPRTHEILGIFVNLVLGRDNPLLDIGLIALLKGARVR